MAVDVEGPEVAAGGRQAEQREGRALEGEGDSVSGSPYINGNMLKTREYDLTPEIGVPVTLIDTVREDEDGNLEIPNLDMLLATVAVARALTPIQMVGAELRFLRHVLHLTGADFAAAIDLSDKSVVSRWENDKVRPGGYTEKIVRQLILNMLGHRAPGIEIPENAIPGMKICRRAASEGPLPMAFSFRSRSESGGRSVDCYAEAA